MDMSPTGDMCYTGGFDGVVCCWSVPSVNTDIYEPYGMILFLSNKMMQVCFQTVVTFQIVILD